MDRGIRRGSDVIKAMCLGARRNAVQVACMLATIITIASDGGGRIPR
jgi:isopentenyl diphosphate isomerase/L-lactate dehydrogenase-like FMN-dependent dehydrogenase